jgi:hypothetical protein
LAGSGSGAVYEWKNSTAKLKRWNRLVILDSNDNRLKIFCGFAAGVP